MKMVAVTACPTGIAHTYMAADALIKASAKMNIKIQVETQGAMGIEDKLSYREISQAQLVLIVSDIQIEHQDRFEQSLIIKASIEEVLTDVGAVLNRCLPHLK